MLANLQKFVGERAEGVDFDEKELEGLLAQVSDETLQVQQIQSINDAINSPFEEANELLNDSLFFAVLPVHITENQLVQLVLQALEVLTERVGAGEIVCVESNTSITESYGGTSMFITTAIITIRT